MCFVAFVAIMLSSCETPTVVTEEPKLEIVTSNPLRVDKDGGIVVVEYSIENPVEGQVVEVDIVNSQMITAADASVDGEVRVSISENTSTDVREGAIIIRYGEQSATIKVMQAGDDGGENPVERIDIQATSLVGQYYGDHLADGLGHYWIIISEEGFVDGNVVPNSEFFRLDILGPLAADEQNIKVPDGKYIFDYFNGYTEYTILNLGNTDHTYVDEALEGWATPLDSAELTVEGNRFELVASVGNKEYHVTFEGDYTISDSTMSEYISNLQGDLVIDVSNCDATAQSFGDYWECGYCNWQIEFVCRDGLKYGTYLVLDFISTSPNASAGFVGTYKASGFSEEDPTKPNFGPGVFVPGMRISDDGAFMMGSLYQRYADGVGVEQAPLLDGTITISDNGNGSYRILIDAVDDAVPAHKITLDWSGRL